MRYYLAGMMTASILSRIHVSWRWFETLNAVMVRRRPLVIHSMLQLFVDVVAAQSDRRNVVVDGSYVRAKSGVGPSAGSARAR
ncbi:MAG: hypothetical protein ACTH31_11935 [Pseudoclavibacter sp.]